MRLLRSPREIADRSYQELRNLAMFAWPPASGLQTMPSCPLPGLPDPRVAAQWVRGSDFEREIVELAAQIRAHRFPLLGITIETGPEIAWRRDYVNQRETGTAYFRRVPYLDPLRAGDHKIIWELNRHQHLVLLAQAFVLTGEVANLHEIARQLESWFVANPFQCGINWASALEVAFRTLSWIWIFHLVGDRLYPSLRGRFLQQLAWHACHLEVNLSFYFSPNTHLLGEAVALNAVGVLFPQFFRAGWWRELGRKVVREQMRRQVRPDGGHFEQSTYYHVYALDMFRFHALLDPPPAEYLAKLQRMDEFLDAVMGPARRLPFFGDDDGGRFFHPFGRHSEYGRATLATGGRVSDVRDLCPQAAWWLGPGPFDPISQTASRASRFFADTGIAVLVEGDIHVVMDVGPFGPWGSGHSHSDTLSLTVRIGEEDILIDPGTYTYMGDPKERDWFRGSAAHNTIRIDGRDQAIPAGAFGWRDQPAVRVLACADNSVEGECQYGGFTHRRRVRLADRQLVIEDEVSGAPGEHDVEQFWHLGSVEARERIEVGEAAELYTSPASYAFGEKHESPTLRIARKGCLPMSFVTVVHLE